MINDCPSAAGSPTQSLRSSPQLRRPSRGEYAFLPTSMPAIPTTSNTAAFIAMTFNHLEMADDFRMIFPVLTTLPIFTSLETFEILSSHWRLFSASQVSTTTSNRKRARSQCLEVRRTAVASRIGQSLFHLPRNQPIFRLIRFEQRTPINTHPSGNQSVISMSHIKTPLHFPVA